MKMFNKIWLRNGDCDWIQHQEPTGVSGSAVEPQPWGWQQLPVLSPEGGDSAGCHCPKELPSLPSAAGCCRNSIADNQQPCVNCAPPVRFDEDVVSFWGLDLSPL